MPGGRTFDTEFVSCQAFSLRPSNLSTLLGTLCPHNIIYTLKRGEEQSIYKAAYKQFSTSS